MAGDLLVQPTTMRRAGHGLLRRPAALKAPLDGRRGQSRKRYPLGQRACHAVGRDQSIGASVAGLHFARHPSHISRRIGPVVVDSINRVLGRGPVANRISERDERRLPSFIHLDATPAVVRERRVAWIGAALLDLAPDTVQRCVGKAVGLEQTTARFADQAAATFCLSLQKRGRSDDGFAAAVTPAQPPNADASGTPFVNGLNDEAPYADAAQVFECSHAQALYSSTGVKQNG
jgi:hypothetical protein